ncbi:AAA family ATPase [Alicyclobacillus herbarius]|uniref:AAA family ATPase n=1 Tax=Alicyclobacillus herbarius TaxID=122960 RepID=UPI0003FD00B4|nr:AAA family ATPase [Alicyclobacillus herbarius]
MNAIDYIRQSAIFDDSPWIKRLVAKVLEDESIEGAIEEILSGTSTYESAAARESVVEQQSVGVPAKVHVDRIVSIDHISNIGLVDVQNRIMCNEGLNIFYGKNGAGKSSVYAALCRVLGKKDKKVIPNLYNDSNESSVQITYLDESGVEHTLTWQMGSEENPETDVMVFDTSIANVLVEQDQVNDFNLAHLKVEYFTYIQNLLEGLELRLESSLSHHKSVMSSYETRLAEKVPFVLTKEGLTREWVLQHDFSESDRVELERITQKLARLRVSPSVETVKNLENAKLAVQRILGLFGSFTENGEWIPTYNQDYVAELNRLIEDFLIAKSLFEAKGNTVAIIPEGWIKSETWRAFITASINFVNSLGDKQEEFTQKTCVYCLQPLQTERSKQLMIQYRALLQEHGDKVKSLERQLQQYVNSLGKVREALRDCYTTITIIESAFDHIGRSGETCIESDEVEYALKSIQSSLEERIPIKEDVLKNIDSFCQYYKDVLQQVEHVLSKLAEGEQERKRQEEELQALAQPLQQRFDLYEAKSDVLGYIDARESVSRISQMLSDISRVKRAVSNLKTKFTNEEVIQTFEVLLKNEYRKLGFEPPTIWRLRSSTTRGVTKRVYSLNDRKLSQIFSEGERKIHALADFFAECQLNKFKGVYIFDDPVNSLDEERMEYVARRIAELVEQGNQVFVFTHNLVFLNLLIGTDDHKVNNITRINRQVVIDSDVKLGDKNVMKKKLDEIERRMKILSQRNEGDISEWELRNIYDLMSGYIEDYVEIILLKNIINRYRPNIRMHTLGSLESIDTSAIKGILDLYNQTSRKGSRHSQPIGAPVPTYAELVQHVAVLKSQYHY